MIANTFEVVAKQLNTYFKSAPSRTFSGVFEESPSASEAGPQEEVVSFLEQPSEQESLHFTPNRVTPILINIEEENKLRPADRFSRPSTSGAREFIQPDVRLNVYILFVSSFKNYIDSLYYTGLITRYFQRNPIFNHQNTPGLHPEADRLIFELVTLPFAAQNEVWNALRAAYRPSLLYRVKMLVFQDQAILNAPKEVEAIQLGKINPE